MFLQLHRVQILLVFVIQTVFLLVLGKALITIQLIFVKQLPLMELLHWNQTLRIVFDPVEILNNLDKCVSYFKKMNYMLF